MPESVFTFRPEVNENLAISGLRVCPRRLHGGAEHVFAFRGRK
jgi:hypothetical protein